MPSLKGVQGGLAKEFTSVGSKGGQTASTAWGRTFQAGIKAATVAATTVVAAGGVAMGVALTKGLGRLNAIDTAKAKLRGLGHDGQAVASIMANSLAAVKGTAFGLDEAATTAAGAVAAGIQPGKQLEATLKTVANVAAATGRGMDDMGAVFNQVAAGGKAYTMQIKQIADAGLPIWQKLGEELGVTTDQVREMVSAGQVDFPTFERAAAEAAGTVALEMGTTLPGALDNAMAAVSRFGANIWKGFEDDDGAYTGIYSKLTGLVLAFTEAMGPVEDLGSRIGNFLGEKVGPVLDQVTVLLTRFGAAGDDAGARFGPLLNALGPAAAMFGALGAGGLAPLLANLPVVGSLLGPIPGLLGAIGSPAGIAAAGLFALTKVDPQQMITGFSQMLGKLPEIFATVQDKIISFAVHSVPAFVDALVTNLPVLVQGITTMVGVIVHQLGKLLPTLVQAAVLLFQGLIHGLVEVLPSLISALIGLVQQLIPTLLSLVPVLVEAALMLFHALIQGLTGIIEPLIDGVLGLLPIIVDTLTELVPQLIDGALTLFMAVVEAIPLIVPPLIEGVLALLPEVLESLLSMIPALLDGAITLFMGIVQALPIILPELIHSILDLLPDVLQTLIGMIPELVDGAITLFTGLVEAIPIVLPELIGAIWDLLPEILGAVLGMVPELILAGKDLIWGLIKGIGDMAGAAVDAVKSLGSSILGGIKGFFGIKSPSKVMAQIGGFLDSGLAGGIGKGSGSVAAMAAMAKQVTAVTNNLAASVQKTANAVAAQVNRIIDSLRSLMSMMTGAFQSTVSGQLAQLAKLFQTVLPSATSGMVARMRTDLGGFQTWVNGPLRTGLASAVKAIQAAFVAVPPAVTAAWVRLRAGTANPTNFVISTVYMSGIRAAVNAITSAAGVKMSMPSVRAVGYASGGVLPGYTPGRDVHRFYNPSVGFLDLSGGEGILRPEVVRALGAGTINAWNASKGAAVHAYKSGGILDFLTKGASGWSVRTNQSTFLAELFGDSKGAMKALISDPAREYAGRAGGGQWGAGAGGSMAQLGGLIAAALAASIQAAMPVEGDLGGAPYTGTPMMWQTLARIITGAGLGARISSAYRPGAITATGYPSYHGMGRAVDIVPPNMAIFNWLASRFPNSTELIYSPAGARQLYKGRPYFYGEPTRSMHFDHVHWAMKQGGIIPTLYDQGGWLPPGLTVAENRTNRPEAIFTQDQLGSLGGVTIENVSVDFGSARSVLEIADYVEHLGLDLRRRGVTVG